MQNIEDEKEKEIEDIPITRKYVAIENNTGDDLQLAYIYGFPNLNIDLPNIVFSTLLMDKTYLPVSESAPYSSFIKDKIAKSSQLKKIGIKYRNLKSDENSFDGYIYEIPIVEIEKALQKIENEKRIYISLYKDYFGSIKYEFKEQQNSSNLKNRVLQNIIIINQSGSKILMRCNLVSKIKFKELEINADALLYANNKNEFKKYNVNLYAIFNKEDQRKENFLRGLKFSLADDIVLKDDNNVISHFDVNTSKLRDYRVWVDVELDAIIENNKNQHDSVIITLDRKEKSSGTALGHATGIELFGGPTVYVSDIKYIDCIYAYA